MLRDLALILDDAPTPPSGLIADAGLASKIAARRDRLAGFRVAQYGSELVLYHPTLTAPDLPWLGPDIRYIRSLGSGFFAPVQMRLNVPDHLLGPLHGELTGQYGCSGDTLFEPGTPLALCDLACSVDMARADFGAMA